MQEKLDQMSRPQAIRYHRALRGKIFVGSRARLRSRKDLSLAYTPGVAAASLAIAKEPDAAYELTRKWNLLAVATDGSRVLGLGNIGPLAALPVMEGKCVLFRELGGIDAFPVCVASRGTSDFVETVVRVSPAFGAINLEDIEAPRCFEVEQRLRRMLDIPVCHDDQHGTAIAVLAALRNALRVVGKSPGCAKIVVVGAGAAGIATAKLLVAAGIRDVTLCDSHGVLHEGRKDLNRWKREVARMTNRECAEGSCTLAVRGADAIIGLSVPGSITREMIKKMSDRPIVFALSNPVPEIMPARAIEAGAEVVATGRSDFPNQVNNALAFPGLFRGALDVRAREINTEMMLAASEAIERCVPEPSAGRIVPSVLDRRVAKGVAAAVGKAARETGVARA